MDKISKSEKRIFKSFLSLREKYPLDKIKVKDICEDADVSKSSFYNYFLDVYDVSDKLEAFLIKDCFNKYNLNKINNIKELIGKLGPSLSLHRNEFEIIANARRDSHLENIEKELFSRFNKNEKNNDMRFVMTFIIGGYTRVINNFNLLSNEKNYEESFKQMNELSKKILKEYGID